MENKNKEQTKYFEQVEKFIKFAEKNNKELERLSLSIDTLGQNIKGLKSLKGLNDALDGMSSSIERIKSYSEELNEMYDDFDSLKELDADIVKAQEMFEDARSKMEKIDGDLARVLDNSSKLNISSIDSRISNISSILLKTNEFLSKDLVNAINEGLAQNIRQLATGVVSIKASLEEYKSTQDEQLELLRQENADIKSEFKRIMETNAAIMEFFNSMKEQNSNAEEFMNNFIEQWYDKNVNFFGKKKN